MTYNPTEDDPRNEWGAKDWYNETLRLGQEIAAETEVRNAIARHSERQDVEIERLSAENKIVNERFDLAQECINKIDDFLEHRYQTRASKEIRDKVMGFIDDYGVLVSTQQDSCEHDWFTPEDNEKVKWGSYQMCRKCHTIGDSAATRQNPITGKYGEPRKYRIEDCPHDDMETHEDSQGYEHYFCPDCGTRAEGDSG